MARFFSVSPKDISKSLVPYNPPHDSPIGKVVKPGSVMKRPTVLVSKSLSLKPALGKKSLSSTVVPKGVEPPKSKKSCSKKSTTKYACPLSAHLGYDPPRTHPIPFLPRAHGPVLRPADDSLLRNNEFFFDFNGRGKELLKEFGDFNLMDLVGDIKRIGAPSKNGFITDLRFRKDHDELGCVLKTTQSLSADNSYYEFLVGLCINRFKERFPNFLFTFNYYQFERKIPEDLKTNSLDMAVLMTTSPELKLSYNKISKDFVENKKTIEDGCINNNNASVLSEAIKDFITVSDFYDSFYFSQHELLNILLQVYHVLSSLSSEFTHYDLHSKNILLKVVPDGKYVEIRYEPERGYFGGEELVIKTRLVPIIIDYGRCYINCDSFETKLDFDKFRNNACENGCNVERYRKPKCRAHNYGLYLKRNEGGLPDIFRELINIEVNNNSQDNRFMYSVIEKLIKKSKESSDFKKIVKNFLKEIEEIFPLELWRRQEYTVPETESDGRNLNTVSDTNTWLKEYYLRNRFDTLDLPQHKYGTIAIKENKPWTFTPA